VALAAAQHPPQPQVHVAIGRAAFALLARAAPLLFAGYAVGTESISPTAFAVVHLGTGALTLTLLVGRGRLRTSMAEGNEFVRPLALAVHALLLASTLLFVDPARGAVALLGSIQLMQWIVAVRRGPRPRPPASLGSLAIVGGIVGLVLPTVSPGLVLGTAFMSLAGFAWAGCTHPDHDPEDALARNARQHVIATVFAISLAVGMYKVFAFTPLGVALAATAGAITAGLRHAGWDRIGERLGARSAVARVAVATIVALGVTTFLVAPLPLPVTLAAAIVLGGTALALAAKHSQAR